MFRFRTLQMFYQRVAVRLAPASRNIWASSRERIPPAAFIFTFGPMLRNRTTSYNCSIARGKSGLKFLYNPLRRGDNPAHFNFSSSVSRHVSIITFSILSPQAFFIALISFSTSSCRISKTDINDHINFRYSIGYSFLGFSHLCGRCRVAVRKPATVQTGIFPVHILRLLPHKPAVCRHLRPDI